MLLEVSNEVYPDYGAGIHPSGLTLYSGLTALISFLSIDQSFIHQSIDFPVFITTALTSWRWVEAKMANPVRKVKHVKLGN